VHDIINRINALAACLAACGKAKGGVCFGVDFHGRFLVIMERAAKHVVTVRAVAVTGQDRVDRKALFYFGDLHVLRNIYKKISCKIASKFNTFVYKNKIL